MTIISSIIKNSFLKATKLPLFQLALSKVQQNLKHFYFALQKKLPVRYLLVDY